NNQAAVALGTIHELAIPLGDGVSLLWSSGVLEEHEAWSVHFPGKYEPGFGCTAETAQLLIAAANGPITSVKYSPAQPTAGATNELSG
ncbi:hypothetical protein, partial [Salmonella enterica]|uniref:hypothetical protein n=1 Tax=Salmonella enterica TaxID=28901 RepID=UPI003FA6E1D2